MWKNLLTLVFIFFYSAPAFAANNVYGSVPWGVATDQDLTGAGQISTGMSFGMLLGYKVNKIFATEIGWTSLLNRAGVAHSTGTETANGIEIAGIALYPLGGKFSAYGRLGYTRLNIFYSLGTSTTLGTTLTSEGLVYGLGVQYDVNEDMSVRVGYNSYDTQNSSGSSIINNAYVSAIFNL